VHQLFPDTEKKMRVALRLLINLSIGVFAPFKYKKYPIAPRPQPPESNVNHGAKIDEAQIISDHGFEIHF